MSTPSTQRTTPFSDYHPSSQSPAQPSHTPSRLAQMRRSSTRLGRLRQSAPDIIGWISIFAGVWSFFLFMLRTYDYHLARYVSSVLDVLNILQAPSLFLAGFMFTFAGAAFRRKRIVVLLLAINESLALIANGLSLTVFRSFFDGYELSLIGINFVLTIFALLFALWAWPAFPSRAHRRSAITALLILFFGELALILSSYAFVLFLGGHHHYRPRTILLWIFDATIGYNSIFNSHMRLPHGHTPLAIVISTLSLVILVGALQIFLRSTPQPLRSKEDDLHIHRLLAQYPSDSLAYFSTGDFRCAIFSDDGEAAVTYCENYGVSLSGGDPIGDPHSWKSAINNWVRDAYQRGLTPGNISCSEKGARAYRAAGFHIREMGDEAVIHVQDFNLSDPAMKPLVAARRRVKRAGVEIRCRRIADISPVELAALRHAAAEYREGDERGFSMSLDRILHPLDFSHMVVTAYRRDDSSTQSLDSSSQEKPDSLHANGTLEALLVFAPWGKHGFSLNVMRRKKGSTNGVIEAMVLELIDTCRDQAIEKISLNFAMFRSFFVQGEAVDATLLERFIRKVMILASKFWQLQSLYESNARYLPSWEPRYFAYENSARLSSTIIASGRLEGFLPAWGEHAMLPPSWINDPEHWARVREIYSHALTAQSVQEKLTDQERARRAKADALHAHGMDPYPPSSREDATPLQELLTNRQEGQQATIHARIKARRDHGGITFLDLFSGENILQVVLERDHTEHYSLVKLTSIGDAISLTGTTGFTRSGEFSLFASSWHMLAKAIRPIITPGKEAAQANFSRNRTMQLIAEPATAQLLRMRSRAVASLRSSLIGDGYLEVETPILQAVKGGANARPFITHMHAYNSTVTLRIAPELYLKRLAVAGMEAVFEMGRSFRNEGADRTHNPEFTSLEAYRANGDYEQMRELTEALIRRASRSIFSPTQPALGDILWQPCERVRGFAKHPLPFAPRLTWVEGSQARDQLSASSLAHAFTASPVPLAIVDVSEPWPVISVCEALSQVLGEEISMDMPREQALHIARAHGIEVSNDASLAIVINELYEELVEPRTGYPTFYKDFPAEVCPLTRKHRKDPRLAERWDLVAFGMEIGTAYTELTDPRDQRTRFIEQSLAAAAGDPEAMSVDHDFLAALDLGLVPTGGMGMGVDRMVMMLLGTDIRSVLTFPFVKPE